MSSKISRDEIDDFARKAEEVQKAIKDMMDGKIRPEDIKIEGIESEEEKAQKEAERIRKQELAKKAAEELRIKRKIEERERWWAGADLFAKKHNEEENECDDKNSASNDQHLRILQRYSFDYSRWDQWTPSDPATLLEEEERRLQEEKRKNEEFEKNNAEFCSQFMEDMKDREKSMQKKKDTAETYRLKGNKFYKRKEYESALQNYLESLKVLPYDVRTLINIAQVHIATKNFEDAVDFLDRTLKLDVNHVKALSRKAFVLSETGNPKEALVLVSKAIKLDSKNQDLIVQHRDLHIIVKELEEEESLRKLCNLPNPKNDDKPAQGSSSSTEHASSTNVGAAGSTTAAPEALFQTDPPLSVGMHFLNLLGDVIRKKNATHKSEKPSEETSDIALSADDEKPFEACTLFLENHKELRVYSRTSGILAECLVYLNVVLGVLSKTDIADGANANANANTNAKAVVDSSSSISGSFDTLCNFLALCIDGERSSKMALVEAGIIQAISSLLQKTTDVRVISSSANLIRVCCCDEICPKSRSLVFKDKALLMRLGIIIGDVCDSFRCASDKRALHVSSKAQAIAMIIACGKTLREMALSEDGRSTCTPDMGPIICAIGSALSDDWMAESNAKKKKSDGKTSSTSTATATKLSNQTDSQAADMKEVLLETLLGLSQIEALRPFFAIQLPSSTSSSSTSSTTSSSGGNDNSTKTTVTNIMHIANFNMDLKSTCLAILMNATLEPEGSVRNEVYQSGCLVHAMDVLRMSDQQRLTLSGGGDTSLFARSIGLLSRLASLPAVQEELKKPDSYQLLCENLKRLGDKLKASPHKTLEKDDADEQSHLIRVIASLNPLPEDCRVRGLKENILENLLLAFPSPRTELEKVTPTSVILPPYVTVSPLLVGNAARCLMPYADHPDSAALLYCDSKLQAVEKLICSMATCSDIRIRKNISILLAKGCKVQGVREKIDHLRGMQMMIELNQQNLL